MRKIACIAAVAMLTVGAQLSAQSAPNGNTSSGASGRAESRPTVVLVHGGFVDGSGWEGVYRILRKDGYAVRIVQNPTLSLAGDVAATRQIVNGI